MKLAVIKTGGKQYSVKPGDKLKVEKLAAEKDSEVIFDQVLLTSADENGKDLKVGDPIVKDAKVTAKVLEQGRAKKVKVVKYKNKTRQHTVNGHRQPFTQVEILSIS